MVQSVQEVAQFLHRALCALSNVCDGATTWDGQGFNKFDASWGQAMAKEDHRDWSSGRCSYILKRTWKYRAQLESHGIQLK